MLEDKITRLESLMAELIERIKYLEKNSNSNHQEDVNKKNIAALHEATKNNNKNVVKVEETIKTIQNMIITQNNDIITLRNLFSAIANKG